MAATKNNWDGISAAVANLPRKMNMRWEGGEIKMISPGQLFGPGAKIRHDHLSDLAVHRSQPAAAGHPRWAGLETMLRREGGTAYYLFWPSFTVVLVDI